MNDEKLLQLIAVSDPVPNAATDVPYTRRCGMKWRTPPEVRVSRSERLRDGQRPQGQLPAREQRR